MLRKAKSNRLLAQMGKNYSHQRSTEKGLTLIESLAAIVIFSLAITAVTPPIILSMATRVRAHRAQQSMQLAQGEIDRVRLVVEAGHQKYGSVDNYKSQLPPVVSAANPEDVPAPTMALSAASPCSKGVPTASTQYCTVEVNRTIFGIQTFRLTNDKDREISAVKVPVAFKMGVRVYTEGSLNQGNLSTEPASLSFSARTNGSAPLIVQYATVVRSDLNHSAEDYRYLLGGE